jgi:hypothetical protein
MDMEHNELVSRDFYTRKLPTTIITTTATTGR